jgi:hypothetical protein
MDSFKFFIRQDLQDEQDFFTVSGRNREYKKKPDNPVNPV